MPILTPITRVTVTVVCDSCQHQALIIEQHEAAMIEVSVNKAVNRLRQEGWKFHYPDAACPTCQLPDRPSGRAYVDKG